MSKSSRLAKNTLLLYVRMLITMSIGLYTSRVVINTLGIEDYGIYNVVGGIVVMFSFFTNSLSTAISRFLTFSIGKHDYDKLNIVFSTSVSIQLAMAFVVCVIAEFVGVWFMNSRINIPEGRIEAANWVIQCSILIFVVNIITVPYQAAIIAHERMNVFAYISILSSVLKLGIAYSLSISTFDTLKVYAVLLMLLQIILLFCNLIYCKYNFKECHYKIMVETSLLKEMFSFASWNLVGSGVYLFNTQGINIITNLFFGVAANAARGIAEQVNGIMMQFVNNFTTALNPQITKSYAIGERDYLFKLICKGAKFSFYLMLFFFVPLIFEIDFVLDIWLKKYPVQTPVFIRLVIIGQMIDFLGNSTARTVWATGKVKKYYIYTGGIASLVFPISYLLFALGFSAEWSYIVLISIYSFLIPIRLKILKDLIGFNPLIFYSKVLLRVLCVSFLSLTIPCIISFCLKESEALHIINILGSFLSVIISILLFGLDMEEKKYLKKMCTNGWAFIHMSNYSLLK